MSTALDEFLRALAAADFPAAGILASGRSDVDIGQAADSLGLKLPGEAVALFQKQDGYREARNEEAQKLIGTGLRFLSLDEAVAAFERIREDLELAVEWHNIEHADWFPVLDRLEVFVVVDCSENEGQRGRVALWDHVNLSPPDDRLESLADAFEIMTRLIESRAWQHTPDGVRDHRTDEEHVANGMF